MITWGELKKAIDELTPDQLKMFVSILDDYSGMFSTINTICITTKNDHYFGEGTPLLVTEFEPWDDDVDYRVIDNGEPSEDELEAIECGNNSFVFYDD